MANEFRKVRALSDKIIGTSLANHKENLDNLISWAKATDLSLRQWVPLVDAWVGASKTRMNAITVWLWGLTAAVALLITDLVFRLYHLLGR